MVQIPCPVVATADPSTLLYAAAASLMSERDLLE